MLNETARRIVEVALGRALSQEEEAGYPSLTALPPAVVGAARTVRKASNIVAASAYLRHVVPSASSVEVLDYMNELEVAGGVRTPDEGGASTFARGPALDDLAVGAAHGAAGLAVDDDDDARGQWLARLSSDHAQDRVAALRAIAALPRANARLLAACERLLDDRTIVLLSIPYRFGEIRWLAAEAVAALRGALGKTEAVVIEDVMIPVSSGDIAIEKLAHDIGVPASTKSGIAGVIERLEHIASAGRMPRRRIRRLPGA